MNVCPICEASLNHHTLCMYHFFFKSPPQKKKEKKKKKCHRTDFEEDLWPETEDFWGLMVNKNILMR